MVIINKGKLHIKSWCNAPESSAIEQAINAANHPSTFHHIALMPDAHMGYGLPVGGVAAFKNTIIPNAVGVDIACGMLAWKTNIKSEILTPEILKQIIVQIKRDIPMGFSHQKTDKWRNESEIIVNKYKQNCILKNLQINENMEISNVYENIGTLGGGNHFLEVLTDEELMTWIIIHSGSRNIGNNVAKKWHKVAIELNEKYHSNIPCKDLAFLPADSIEGQTYLNDMEFCTDFSFQNRICMMSDIEYAFNRILDTKIEFIEKYNIHHNFVSLENHFGQNVWVHRKGATRVREGEIGIIPGSMGTHSYIVKGKGNPDSFMSCSHGAGRTMSRTAASEKFNLTEFKEKMKGIVSLDIDNNHIDESPMAYKDIENVMFEQEDLISIVHKLTPLANIKG